MSGHFCVSTRFLFSSFCFKSDGRERFPTDPPPSPTGLQNRKFQICLVVSPSTPKTPMCPHCCNTLAGGCIHCRPDQNESAREYFQITHGRPSATRLAISVVPGRLFSPPDRPPRTRRRPLRRGQARLHARFWLLRPPRRLRLMTANTKIWSRKRKKSVSTPAPPNPARWRTAEASA